MAENSREWALEYAAPLLRNGLEQLVDSVTPGLPARLAADPAAHDEYLAVLGLVVAESETMLADAVLAARNSGRTWSQIAGALGLDRAAVQARFTGNTPNVTQIGTTLIAAPNDGDLAPVPAQTPGFRLGDVRRVQFSKFGRVADLNLLGVYGWQVISVELTSDWNGAIATAQLDNQQWEYQVTSRRKKLPEGIGWLPIEGPGAWAGAVYWGRPTGQPVRPGNPEPVALLGIVG